MKRFRKCLFFAVLATLSCSASPRTWSGVPDDVAVPFTLSNIAPETLQVMTYNVFLRPEPVSFGDETRCRARRIGSWLADSELDFVALTETFQPDDVRTLSSLSKNRFPHQVLRQPQGGALGISGGLSLLSRWPIESTRTIRYDECSGTFSDCVAAKGALHAVVRVSQNERVNVVATHLDAGGSASDRTARAAQIEQLRTFLDEVDQELGPTIVLGDFNIDALNGDGEYEEMMLALALAPSKVDAPSTLNCSTSIWCHEPVPDEQLDYVFTRTAEKRLQREVTYHHPMEDAACGARYLSDHRAVLAGFTTRF